VSTFKWLSSGVHLLGGLGLVGEALSRGVHLLGGLGLVCQAFYGCVECAANFAQEWEEEGGEDQFGHVPTSLWLW
jgi:hypothetical protein